MSDDQQPSLPSYTCAACHETFTASRTDADAKAEAKTRDWAPGNPDEGAWEVVCDDCFQQINAWGVANAIG